jgi:alpha-glucosidase
MVEPDAPDELWKDVEGPYGQGISTNIGAILVDATGKMTLLNAKGSILTQTEHIIGFSSATFATAAGLFYGSGGGSSDAKRLDFSGNVTPVVLNRGGQGSVTYVPYFYNTEGYAALGVVRQGKTDTSGGAVSATYETSEGSVKWSNTCGGPLELYLMPAAALEQGTLAYYRLIGSPRVPPLYSFGFIASRWGWKDRSYIEETLQHFRSGFFPADGFIVDFEWYTKESDYAYDNDGKRSCDDFGFYSETFPEPKEQLARYRHELHFHMAGIRKPRLCNRDNLKHAESQNWILQQGEPDGAGFLPSCYGVGRELDFSNPDLRAWYATQTQPLLDNGVDFWWNDEGESSYFTFLWWNEALRDSLRKHNASKRFYSLNRNFAPGMARMGAAVWTGDSSASWEGLSLQPGYLLNWALAGAPYVGSDIGGFIGESEGELLARWSVWNVCANDARALRGYSNCTLAVALGRRSQTRDEGGA